MIVFGGDATDAGALLGELRVEPQIEILAAASAITPNSIFQELSKHADTINISIGIGEPGARLVAHVEAWTSSSPSAPRHNFVYKHTCARPP